MKKLEKFLKQSIEHNDELTMPTKEELKKIDELTFGEKFYWSIFLELYYYNESWDFFDYETLKEEILKYGKEEILNTLSRDFIYYEDFEMVIKLLKKYLKKYPHNYSANYKIATAYQYEGEIDKSIDHYHKSFEIDMTIDSCWALAKLYKYKEEYDTSLNYYQLLLDRELSENGYYMMILEIGDIYRDTDKKEEAIECYKKAVKINNRREDKPRNYFLYIKIGTLAKNRKQKIKNFKKAVSVRPERHEAYFNLGYQYLSAKKNKKAIETFKNYLKVSPPTAQVYVNMGLAYGSLDKDNKAMKCYKKAIKTDENVFQSYLNLFHLYEDEHKYPPKEYEEMFLTKFKNNKDVYINYLIVIYLLDIYHGKEIDLTIIEKKYKNAGMSCCTLNPKKLLKSIRKRDREQVSKLIEVLKEHTNVIKEKDEKRKQK